MPKRVLAEIDENIDYPVASSKRKHKNRWYRRRTMPMDQFLQLAPNIDEQLQKFVKAKRVPGPEEVNRLLDESTEYHHRRINAYQVQCWVKRRINRREPWSDEEIGIAYALLRCSKREYLCKYVRSGPAEHVAATILFHMSKVKFRTESETETE